MNNRQKPDTGRRVYRPDDLVNGRFATHMSGPVARQIALALKGYRLSGAIRAVPQACRSGPWAVTVSRMAWKGYSHAVDYVRGYYWGLHDRRWRRERPSRGGRRHGSARKGRRQCPQVK